MPSEIGLDYTASDREIADDIAFSERWIDLISGRGSTAEVVNNKPMLSQMIVAALSKARCELLDLISELSSALTDEGPDWSEKGLERLRRRICALFPGDYPYWETQYGVPFPDRDAEGADAALSATNGANDRRRPEHPVTTTEFFNELGNRIRITIEGPYSTSENVLTLLEAERLQKSLANHRAMDGGRG